jgi:hypothetical protein
VADDHGRFWYLCIACLIYIVAGVYMDNMKLIMEGWRAYQSDDFEYLCESYRRRTITEARLFELWEANIDRECHALINEGPVADALELGYEKGKQLVGKAKETYDRAMQKISDLYIRMLNQVWSLLQTIKKGLGKIAGALKGIHQKVSKFCDKQPLICSIVKFLLIMIAVAAVMALFSSEAQAAVDTSGMGGGDGAVLSDDGLSAIKAFLQIGAEDASPEAQQMSVDALRWVESAHSSDQLVDLANSTADGAELVRRSYSAIKEMSADAGPGFIQGLVNVGEDVVVKSNSYVETINNQGNVTITSIEWSSLTTR